MHILAYSRSLMIIISQWINPYSNLNQTLLLNLRFEHSEVHNYDYKDATRLFAIYYL